MPGGILKLADNTGASDSAVGSSFSPGGTNNELHDRVVAKFSNNNL